MSKKAIACGLIKDSISYRVTTKDSLVFIKGDDIETHDTLTKYVECPDGKKPIFYAHTSSTRKIILPLLRLLIQMAK